MLVLRSVKKNYGQRLILDIPMFTAEAGVYWLKGANGAGKSTVLKMIAGMIPFEGDIELLNINLRAAPAAYRRLVNYVEAEPLYPPFLSGSELVRFFQDTRRAPARQAEELQEAFGIHQFVNDPINTYSSGMVKKLSLILAFIGSPSLILLDEPLVTIDKDTVPVLYELIRSYADKGISFIIASHQEIPGTSLAHLKVMSVIDHQLCVG